MSGSRSETVAKTQEEAKTPVSQLAGVYSGRNTSARRADARLDSNFEYTKDNLREAGVTSFL